VRPLRRRTIEQAGDSVHIEMRGEQFGHQVELGVAARGDVDIVGDNESASAGGVGNRGEPGTPEGVVVDIPTASPDPISSTVVLKIKGRPEVETPSILQQADGTIQLPAAEAELIGGLQYESGDGKDNIGYWTDPGDCVSWAFRVNQPGKFQVTAQIAALGQGRFEIVCGDQTLSGTASDTGDYAKFQTVELGGTLTITTTGPGIAGGAGTSTVNLDGITLKAGAGNAGYITNVTTVNVNAGGVAFDTAGFDVVIPQVLANGGGGLSKFGAGKLTLSKVNTYAGDTVIGVGTLALVEPGSIAGSMSILISNTAVLDVTGRSDQTLTLNNGQSLRGSGTVAGKLNAPAGSTVNPGDTIGTLTVQSNITLGGTLVMELNRGNVPMNDKLASTSGSIGGGGTLTVNNLGGALQGGDVFYLFNQAVDGFATVNLPALTGGNAWQNNMAMDGSIRVVSTNAAVIATGISVGDQLTLAWPADHIGWRLEVQTNALATGLGTNWVDVIGAVATNVMTMPINPANGGVFFRLVFP